MLLVTVICAVLLLWPGISKLFATANGKLIIVRNIERNILPVQNEGELYRDLAFYYNDAFEANEVVLQKTRRLYFAAIIFGVLQLSAWIVLVWFRG